MGERFNTRAAVVTHALARSLWRKAGAGPVRRVLIAHNLLLGDTLMLTPLIAKLRAVHPAAEVDLLASPAFVPLYAGRPYGVRALPFAPSRSATTRELLGRGPYDLAFVAGDNRYSWLAAALGARHIVAHTGGPARSNWFVDEAHPYEATPAAWGDIVARLLEGPDPAPYARGDWPDPPAAPFEAPTGPYAVLHVGASTALKQWLPERWNALARSLAAEGLQVAWSAGRGEEAIVAACDPAGEFTSYAGVLDLAQLWRLLRGAQLLVAPDTGVAHLGRAAWAPTVALFGPGSQVLCDPGQFWRDTPWLGIGEDPFPCRDQQRLFHRDVAWVRRCARSTAECPEPRCMHAISLETAIAAARKVRSASHPAEALVR